MQIGFLGAMLHTQKYYSSLHTQEYSSSLLSDIIHHFIVVIYNTSQDVHQNMHLDPNLCISSFGVVKEV